MTTQPTEATIRAVAAAISRAEIHDDRMTSDPQRLRAWADTAQPHGITDTSLACRAIDTHYTAPGANTIRVGDFIATYRRLRATDGETDKGRQLANGTGGIARDGEPVWDAYDQHGAIERHCPTCEAAPMEACVRRGKVQRIPCATRLSRKGRGL